jgi:hypothetical protein
MVTGEDKNDLLMALSDMSGTERKNATVHNILHNNAHRLVNLQN